MAWVGVDSMRSAPMSAPSDKGPAAGGPVLRKDKMAVTEATKSKATDRWTAPAMAVSCCNLWKGGRVVAVAGRRIPDTASMVVPEAAPS